MSLAASAGRGPGALWSPTHVQVTVLQARGLRAKGPGGTSDAYAVIQVGKEKYATSVSERSLGAPVWREEATFELPPLLASGAAPAAAATLQLTVLHRALLGLDKFLGRAEVDLRELHQNQGRRKTQWYPLKSKPGKKDKERGEIEVDIQFMRNNMTASMFDLSAKDKSRNPFGKLKDKLKSKNKDSASDTSSAIVPSATASVDSDDDGESPTKDKKKRSKIKTLFSKSNLQRTPLSQSMLVLPTTKADKTLLRPGDLQSRWGDDEDEDEASSASDVTSHKRTGSGDLKQLSQINFSLPKKEGLSFLGGLRSKHDSLSRSNVCINGSHVYLEQPEARSETKDSSASSSPSPQGFRKKHLFSSTENLASRPWKEPMDGGDRWLAESPTKDPSKSMSLPSYRPQASGDSWEERAPAATEAARESQETKKQENKKTSLLSLVTGKKEVTKNSEGENAAAGLARDKESKAGPGEDLGWRAEKDAPGISSSPFEDVPIMEPEADPEVKPGPKAPVPTPRVPQTKAVKPRLDVSPEAQPKTRLPSCPAPLPVAPPRHAQTPVVATSPHVPPESGPDPEPQPSQSPLATPLSTSTPIQSWPSPSGGEGQPPRLLQAALSEESLTSTLDETGSHTGGGGSGRASEGVPSAREAPENQVASAISPAQELHVEADSGPAGQHGSLMGNKLRDDHDAGDVTEQPFQDTNPNVTVRDGQKKAKKRVSFSEQLLVEEEEEEDGDAEPPQEPAADRAPDMEHNGATPAPVTPSHQLRGPEVLSPDTSETSDILSDHPPSPDAHTPVLAELNLTLPSIPEVASDDEGVDQVEDWVALDVGASSRGICSEEAKGPADRADAPGPPAKRSHDCRKATLQAPVPAAATQPAAFKPSSSVDPRLLGAGPDTASPAPSPVPPEDFPITCHTAPSSPPLDTHHGSPAEFPKKAAAEASVGKIDSFGKRKPLLQAWVSPSETHPLPAQPGVANGAARHRLHPVKPMNTSVPKNTTSNLGTATIISENLINEAMMKKYNPSDPASAYAQLTHDELVQLVLKQKEAISKKELQVRELEDYIDNLLVRVMEETPNILRIPTPAGQKAGKM